MVAENTTQPGGVMIIAGETSGDHHGALLVAAMRKIDGDLTFFGIGGGAMKREGVDVIVDADSLSVVGITEVFSRIPSILRGISNIKRAVVARKPGLVILIDFPDFNLHIAKYVKRFSIPVLYYISPQLWAWRLGRIKKIRKYVTRMAVILPFEKAFYSNHGVPVSFVGHPLLDCHSVESYDAFLSQRIMGKTVIGLLPGSRNQEVSRNLPTMLAAASQINRKSDNISFVVSVAPGININDIDEYILPYRNVLDIRTASGDIETVLTQCTLVVAVSGTVTLESAIHGVPMVIVYQVSPVSYMFGCALIRVEHIGLANIIAGERVVPELIQGDATPARIARTVSEIIRDPVRLGETRKKLRMVRDQLGGPGASRRTAGIAYSMMRQT